MKALEFVVMGLAIWRLSSLLTDPLDGDFAILLKLRYAVGIRYDKHSNPYAAKREWLCKWFLCSWCMSLALGTISTILYMAFGHIIPIVLLPFALSATSILVDSYILRMTRRRNH